jgi:hypothetical protein
MKRMRYLITLLILVVTATSSSQNQFRVFPIDGKTVTGNPNGDGSISKPWDLKTALSQSSERVNGGDIIWIHKGIYTGRYRSVLQSTIPNTFITVSAYEGDRVILNGNVDVKAGYVLDINGGGVSYKNFEITFLGKFSRLKKDRNFNGATGINHKTGEDCKFQNLISHDIPGSAIGSWKATGGTIIEDCVIYNNGYGGQEDMALGFTFRVEVIK